MGITLPWAGACKTNWGRLDGCQWATDDKNKKSNYIASHNFTASQLPFPILTQAEVTTQSTPGSTLRSTQNGWGRAWHTGVTVLRHATQSRWSFTPSAQLGESFQRGGTNVRGSSGSMLLTGALLRCAAWEGSTRLLAVCLRVSMYWLHGATRGVTLNHGCSKKS